MWEINLEDSECCSTNDREARESYSYCVTGWAKVAGPIRWVSAHFVPCPASLALSRFISFRMCFSCTTRNMNTTAKSVTPPVRLSQSHTRRVTRVTHLSRLRPIKDGERKSTLQLRVRQYLRWSHKTKLLHKLLQLGKKKEFTSKLNHLLCG